jgi:hypothetical protein
MNSSKTLGIILVTIGILMMLYTGFTYFTTEKVVDIGSLHIAKEKSHLVTWPPVVGAIFLLAGLIMLGTRKAN